MREKQGDSTTLTGIIKISYQHANLLLLCVGLGLRREVVNTHQVGMRPEGC